MSRTSLNAIARSSDGQCIPFMIRISCRSVMTRTRLAAATAAGRSRCRKPRCGWPRPRWRTATRPCPHSAANSGSPTLVTLPAPTCSSSGHPTPPRRGPGRKAHRISWSTGFRSRLTLLARLPEGLSRCRLGFPCPLFLPSGETRHSRHARRPRCACAVASPSVRLPPGVAGPLVSSGDEGHTATRYSKEVHRCRTGSVGRLPCPGGVGPPLARLPDPASWPSGGAGRSCRALLSWCQETPRQDSGRRRDRGRGIPTSGLGPAPRVRGRRSQCWPSRATRGSILSRFVVAELRRQASQQRAPVTG